MYLKTGQALGPLFSWQNRTRFRHFLPKRGRIWHRIDAFRDRLVRTSQALRRCEVFAKELPTQSFMSLRDTAKHEICADFGDRRAECRNIGAFSGQELPTQSFMSLRDTAKHEICADFGDRRAECRNIGAFSGQRHRGTERNEKRLETNISCDLLTLSPCLCAPVFVFSQPLRLGTIPTSAEHVLAGRWSQDFTSRSLVGYRHG